MSKKERTLQGVVVSDKSDKTIVVQVASKVKHPLYDKYITRTTKFHVHDEKNEAKSGSVVEIKESRPISKKKSWILVGIISAA